MSSKGNRPSPSVRGNEEAAPFGSDSAAGAHTGPGSDSAAGAHTGPGTGLDTGPDTLLVGNVDSGASFFLGRSGVVATCHGKEQVIQFAFQDTGIRWRYDSGLDTDQFGTFSGEVPRTRSMKETALIKARTALQTTGCEIAIASEGSFGPHPSFPWVVCDMELLVLIDARHGWTFTEELIRFETNYAQITTSDAERLHHFARRAHFPSHALILRPKGWEPGQPIFKGITTESDLLEAWNTCRQLGEDTEVVVETDMRAHLNPTRMGVIEDLAHQLASSLRSKCPKCQLPGFTQRESVPGLPCSCCERPTAILLYAVLVCPHCEHKDQYPRSDGRQWADPGHCQYCNP